jgi:glutathione S-transferase
MILHDLSAGMHPRRVRIFLAEKGVSLPTKVVDAVNGENKTDDFLRMNPMGRLPVLQLDDGTAIAESLAICRYIETLHPQPPLWGEGPLDAALVDMWTRRMEQQVSSPIADIFLHSGDFYRGRIVQVPAYAEWLREHVAHTLAWNLGHTNKLRQKRVRMRRVILLKPLTHCSTCSLTATMEALQPWRTLRMMMLSLQASSTL